MQYLSIPRLQDLTGYPLRDGARVTHTSYEEAYYKSPTAGWSIERKDRYHSSMLHRRMKENGMAHYGRLGYRIFPRQVGLWGCRVNSDKSIWRWSDFAVEKHDRVTLVECLTPWNLDTEQITQKRELEIAAPVAFICVAGSLPLFRIQGFRHRRKIGRFDRYHIILVIK